MRLSALLFASTLLLGSGAAVAATGPQAPDPAPSWSDFDDPGFDPAAPQTAVAAATEPAASSRAHDIALGPLGVDEDGVRGRIHTVSSGETLWDISDAYLGTPWVWPSVWNDNAGIENPHVIQPGDHIWITSNEMRRVTPAEAEELVSSAAEPVEDTVVAAFAEPPEESMPLEEPMPEEPQLEALPSLEPTPSTMETGSSLTIPPEQSGNLVTVDVLEAAATIIDSPTLRVMLTQGDEVYVGLGEGEVTPGDEFAIFRESREIRDPETRALLGHHIEQIGWLRIDEVEGSKSHGVIAEATDEMQRGDSIIPREKTQRQIAVRRADPETRGMIALMPGYRHMGGATDSVYLNLGSIHGIEVGSKLAVYSGTGRGLDLPGAVMARMVVTRVEPEVSVAFVTDTKQELQVGDEVRGLVSWGGGHEYSQR